MNAFRECQSIEEVGRHDVESFFDQHWRAEGQVFGIYGTGPNLERLQRHVGDYIARFPGNAVKTIDLKSEAEDRNGNFFLETWSNCPVRLGWLFTSSADLILYHFQKEGRLYAIEMHKLQAWAFHEGRIYRHEERTQKKHSQKNETRGRCVPIEDVRREVGFREWQLTDGNWSEVPQRPVSFKPKPKPPAAPLADSDDGWLDLGDAVA